MSDFLIVQFTYWFCREEQRHVQKRKKRRVKGPSRLSFADEIDGDTDEENEAAGT